MLSTLKTFIRRRVRAIQRRNYYPVLLPHHRLTDQGLATLNQSARPIGDGLKKALLLCDGTRSLGQVASAAGVPMRDLIAAHEQWLIILWRSPVPAAPPILGEHHPHSIVLSPHLDDAALSCGGRLLGDQTTLVVNVFAGAWWRFPFTADDLPMIRTIRHAEDELAMRLAGFARMCLELPEALARGHTFEGVFTEPLDARDDAVRPAMAQAIEALAKAHPMAHWFIPLGIGQHVDHRLVREVALDVLLGAAKMKRSHVHFYEDQPYAAHSKPGDFASAHPEIRLAPDPLDVDDIVAGKLELLRVYHSQITPTDIAAIGPYMKRVGDGDAAEVVWNLV